MKFSFLRTIPFFILSAALFSGCFDASDPDESPDYTAAEPAAAEANENSNDSNSDQLSEEEKTMNVEVNGHTFRADLADTEAARELAEQLKRGPIRLSLHEYGGFEKTGDLGRSYTASDVQVTARPGDLMLYQGDEISVFYGNNRWAYTPLAHVSDLEGWAEALGNQDAEIILSAE